jgi:hypothetical protein
MGWAPPPPAPSSAQPAPAFDLGHSPADEELTQPPAINGTRRRLIASVVAVLVVVAGAVITYTALNDAGGDGAASPRAAVDNAIKDLHNGDVIGLLDDMPSGERAALSGPFQDDVTSLKRLGVLSSKADPHKVTGITFTVDNISYAPATVQVNDHVQIVKIIGGTITANANALNLPLTSHMLNVTHAASAHPVTQTVDLSTVSGGVRIATVKQSGRWYVSLFYTAADGMANHQIPTSADYVAAKGADSATDAVRSEVTALLGGKLSDALALISPDELGAVHDYGGLILSASDGFPDSGVSISSLDLNQTPLSDGAVKVTLSKLSLTTQDGKKISVVASGSCFTITMDGTTKKQCASDSISTLEQLLGEVKCLGEGGLFGESEGGSSGSVYTVPSLGDGGSGDGSSTDGPLPSDFPTDFHTDGSFPTDDDPFPTDDFPDCTPTELTAGQKAALTHLVSGESSLGVVVSQSGGTWFLDPIRTIAELSSQTIGSLQGDDLFALISIFTG